MSTSLGKDLLVFDAANASDSDNVGAYLRASDGTLITHTTVGPKQALDVNMVNSIEVDISAADGDSVIVSDGTNNLAINSDGSLNAVVTATDLDIRNLVFATDKVDVSGSVVALDAGTLAALEDITVSATDLDIRDLVFATDKVDVSGSAVTVSATDLDIRDLSSATDSVSAVQSGAWSVEAHGNIADDGVDSGNPLKVGSRAFAGALSAISTSGDRADLLSDMYRRVYINDSANIGSKSAAVSVTDSEVALSGSPLAGRRRMIVENLGATPIFVGPTGVSAASGLRVAAGGSLSLDVGQNVALFAIGATATARDVRVFELA